MKRKKYYNKKKFELNVPHNASPIEILRTIRPEKTEKEKNWFDFASNNYKKRIKDKPEEDLGLILKLIHSKQTINRIIKYFYQIDNFNPNVDNLPLDENTPKDILNIIKKKQNYIKQFFDFRRQFVVDKNVLVMFNKINAPAYLSIVDIVIGLSGEYVYIYAKDLNDIYLRLNEIEPDTWELRKDYIFNWKQKTSLDFLNKETIEKIFN